MKYSEIFDKYRQEYQGALRQAPYRYSSKKTMPYCNLLVFEGGGNDTFLVVPSIFNSHDILTIGTPSDMISKLRDVGSVYLIEWLEIENKDFGLSDYAKVVVQVLDYLNSIKAYICVIGHCLGGNLALAASLIRPKHINSLILLTTPWNFSHLSSAKALFNLSGFNKAVEGFDHIPAIYMQMLFFLISPQNLEKKLNFYHINQGDIDKSVFFEIERWQFSGHPIPRKTYDELINEWIDGRIFAKGIMGVSINPAQLKMPVMLVTCKKDKLVPSSASKALRDIASVFEYDTGHIGYLVGSKRDKFLADLIGWIKPVSK